MSYKNKEQEKEKRREYYIKNKEKILLQANKYYADNKERCLKNVNNYRLNNLEYYKEYKKIWSSENKDKIKGYYNENKDSYRERNKKRYLNNKEEMIEKVTIYRKERIKNDPNFNLGLKLRSKLNELLKSTLNPNMSLNIQKKKETIINDLVGCTLFDLKRHFERQFKEGMSWDNWSFYGWHIDHIKPVCKFNLLDPIEKKIAFHYTNLQPLWAHENRLKLGSYNEELTT